jgi:hypothetical protein
MTGRSVFVIATGLTILIIFSLLLMTRDEVVAQYKSPMGRYYIVMSRLYENPLKSVMPGDSGWHQYVYRLYCASNNIKLASSLPVEMKDVDEEPVWLEDSVAVPHEQYLLYHDK